MIYIEIFLNFLKVGIFSFGGGYSAIPLMRDATVLNGWITEEVFLDILAIAESTPGPIMINIPTYAGVLKGGIFGGICAVLGIALPAFLIILFYAKVSNKFQGNEKREKVFSFMRPLIFAIIFFAGIDLFIKNLNIMNIEKMNIRNIIIFFILILIQIIYKKIKSKKISRILFILISVVVGILVNII